MHSPLGVPIPGWSSDRGDSGAHAGLGVLVSNESVPLGIPILPGCVKSRGGGTRV